MNVATAQFDATTGPEPLVKKRQEFELSSRTSRHGSDDANAETTGNPS